jgi:hypothetical protein
MAGIPRSHDSEAPPALAAGRSPRPARLLPTAWVTVILFFWRERVSGQRAARSQVRSQRQFLGAASARRPAGHHCRRGLPPADGAAGDAWPPAVLAEQQMRPNSVAGIDSQARGHTLRICRAEGRFRTRRSPPPTGLCALVGFNPAGIINV